MEDKLERQTEKYRTVEDKLERQTEKYRTVEDKLERQTEKYRTVGDKLERQTEKYRTVEDKLERQTEKYRTVEDKLERQTEKYRTVGDKLETGKTNREIQDSGRETRTPPPPLSLSLSAKETTDRGLRGLKSHAPCDLENNGSGRLSGHSDDIKDDRDERSTSSQRHKDKSKGEERNTGGFLIY